MVSPRPSGSTRSARKRRSSSACDAAIRVVRSDEIARVHRLLAGRLRSAFATTGDPEWPWPEPILTYENALPVRALIVAGAHHRSRPMLDIGLARLDWLIDIQTVDGHFSPIGNGWWPRGGKRTTFDQQPIEPTSLLLAAEAAYVVTGQERYRDAMELAYAWFLGGERPRRPGRRSRPRAPASTA